MRRVACSVKLADSYRRFRLAPDLGRTWLARREIGLVGFDEA